MSFNVKIEALMKTHTGEKEVFQNKINEIKELNSTVEKEVMTLQHQKNEITKQLKEITKKYDLLTEEKFGLTKTV